MKTDPLDYVTMAVVLLIFIGIAGVLNTILFFGTIVFINLAGKAYWNN